MGPGPRGRTLEVSAEPRLFADVGRKCVLARRIEDRPRSVDPHLVVVPRDRGEIARALERVARRRRLVDDVADAEHDLHRHAAPPKRAQRLDQLAVDAAGPLVDDHQMRGEPEDRLLEHPAPDVDDFRRPARQERRAVVIGRVAIEARKLDVIGALRDAERMDHRRSGDDQQRGAGIVGAERLGQEQRAADVTEPEGVVRIEQDLRRCRSGCRRRSTERRGAVRRASDAG